MPSVGDVSKRLLIGRKLATDRLQHALLPKRVALPVYSSDALSSVAYATQELLVILTLGGLSYLYLAPWAATAVVVLMVVVVASYRHLVQAHPGGGGSYDAAASNLGTRAGLVAGGASLVDYVFTIAVAVAAAVDNLVSAFPGTHDARLMIAAAVVAVLALATIRGMGQTGPLFAVPTYLFIAGILVTVLWGLGRTVAGDPPTAESAGYDIAPELSDLTVVALVVLLLRAFAGGSVLLTGIGTVASAVPAFRKPRRKNAATTLGVMGVVAVALFAGVTALALVADVRYTRDPCDLLGFACETDPQRTVVAQLSAAVFGDATPVFYIVVGATVLILLLAANAAYQGLPVLGSVLARHGYLPRQLHHQGDRLAFGNAILTLAVAAIVVVMAFEASVSRLVPLYLAGSFLAMTLGQLGMVREWSRRLDGPLRPDERAAARRARLVNGAGAALTAIVLVVVTVADFLAGVWLVFAAVVLVMLVMRGIRGYYEKVEAELSVDEGRSAALLPSRVHAIVLVSRLHKPTMRALAYARSGHPDLLEAITVNTDLAATRALTDEWDRREIPVPLKVLDSPYREISRPVLEYVRGIRRESPRDLVVVYIPEYVVGRWWEQLLHNKSALRLRGRLLFTPGVMVTSVPWQLDSSGPRGESR
ncbi:MAG TPA: amino acid permease [Jiangellaceae bacterium]|nr:amino acid permease [Jiangellaceae bacterium]